MSTFFCPSIFLPNFAMQWRAQRTGRQPVNLIQPAARRRKIHQPCWSHELRGVFNTSNDFINDYYYDKLDRLTVIDQSNTNQAKRVTFAYNALGQRTQLDRYESYGTTPSIATTAYSYDTANRLSKIEHRKGATVFNAHDYLFDRMSRIASVTSVDGKVDYSYDPLSQLLAATDPQSPDHLSSQAFSYTYDHNGNRNNTGYTAPTDDRVQTAPGGETYEYDLEGNLKRIAVGGVTSHLLTWDNRNRLTQAQVFWTGGSAIINYEYDAFNRLVKRTQSGNATYWGYDEGINPHLQSDAGSISHRYLWSDQVDELLADEQNLGGTGWNTAWALPDHQGTIKDILDFNPTTSTSSVVNHRRYDAFGNRISQSGTVDIVFGYTGKYFDQVTGLQNSWNRWYSPKMGRFISQDPIGFAAGDANFYRYVGNEATGATDPSGMWGEPIGKGVRVSHPTLTFVPDTFGRVVDVPYLPNEPSTLILQTNDFPQKLWGTTAGGKIRRWMLIPGGGGHRFHSLDMLEELHNVLKAIPDGSISRLVITGEAGVGGASFKENFKDNLDVVGLSKHPTILAALKGKLSPTASVVLFGCQQASTQFIHNMQDLSDMLNVPVTGNSGDVWFTMVPPYLDNLTIFCGRGWGVVGQGDWIRVEPRSYNPPRINLQDLLKSGE